MIWTHRDFYEEKNGEGRSRNPIQTSWLGSYEEALSHLIREGIETWILLYGAVQQSCKNEIEQYW